jgi:hypothetical protein
MITYLRVFAAIQYRTNRDSVEVEFEKPDLHAFIHELYKESARYAWQYAYLFKTHGVLAEQQARNRRDIENLLQQSLDTTIDNFLPWKSIAEQYFKEPAADVPETTAVVAEEESEEEESEDRGVKFNLEEEEEEEEEVVPKLQISEEEVTLETESIDILAKEEPLLEEKVELQPESSETLELTL